MDSLPDYDAWKLACPPEYEEMGNAPSDTRSGPVNRDPSWWGWEMVDGDDIAF